MFYSLEVLIFTQMLLNVEGNPMQIDKINSSQSFGAKLKLYGVNKKYWNLSSEEIGTPQDKVFF